MYIGCGAVVYGIQIAKSHPGLKVTLLDLAAMAAEAGEYAKRAGVTERVGTAACNMFTEAWPTGPDAHFFATVFHDWSVETNKLLAQQSFDALPPGRRIFPREVPLDAARAGPRHAATLLPLMLS